MGTRLYTGDYPRCRVVWVRAGIEARAIYVIVRGVFREIKCTPDLAGADESKGATMAHGRKGLSQGR